MVHHQRGQLTGQLRQLPAYGELKPLKRLITFLALMFGASLLSAQVAQEPVTVQNSAPTGSCNAAPLTKVSNVGTYQCIGGVWVSFATGSGFSGSPINPQTATYQAVAADFSAFKTISVASGTFTVTLVASGTQPAAGQYINVQNYGSGVITIARSGQNINGGTSSITLPAGSATAPTSVTIASDGTNYFTSAVGTSGNATTINGASVPASQPCLGSNSGSQLIAGTCGGSTGQYFLPASGDTTCATDSAAISAAITAGNTSIRLGLGPYYVDAITISTTTASFIGVGRAPTVIRKCNATGYEWTLNGTSSLTGAITSAYTFERINFQMASGVTPTAGGFFDIKGSNPNYLVEAHINDVLMAGPWGGIYVENFVLNSSFTSITCSAIVSNGCIRINDALGGGNLTIRDMQTSAGSGTSNGGIVIDQSDTVLIDHMTTGGASIVFTQAAAVYRVRMTHLNIEDSTSGCGIDAGTGGTVPHQVEIGDGSVIGTGESVALCNTASMADWKICYNDTSTAGGGSTSGYGVGCTGGTYVASGITGVALASGTSGIVSRNTPSPTTPELGIVNSGGGTDNKISDIVQNTAGLLSFRFINDADNAATTWMSVARTAYNAPTTLSFAFPNVTNTVAASTQLENLTSVGQSLVGARSTQATSAGHGYVFGDRGATGAFAGLSANTAGTGDWFIGEPGGTSDFQVYQWSNAHSVIDVSKGGPNSSLAISATGAVSSVVSFAAPSLISTVATGTPPLTVASTTQVTNLNSSAVVGKAPTGAGAALPTGPTSSTSGDVTTFSGTSGQIQDSGTALTSLATAINLASGTPTFTAGTNVTSVACAASYTCTNARGELTIVGGTATTGTIATVNFSATLSAAPGLCQVTQEGGAALFGIGHGVPSTSSFTISAGISVAASTVTVDYSCQP